MPDKPTYQPTKRDRFIWGHPFYFMAFEDQVLKASLVSDTGLPIWLKSGSVFFVIEKITETKVHVATSQFGFRLFAKMEFEKMNFINS